MNKLILVVVCAFFVVDQTFAQGAPPPPPPPQTVPIDGVSGLLAMLGVGYVIRRFKKEKEQ